MDYPPGINPYITYGIHRCFTETLIDLVGHYKLNLLSLIQNILKETTVWETVRPMKDGLIDINRCGRTHQSRTLLQFIDWIDWIRYAQEEKTSNGRYGKKKGIKLSVYECRFLKDITSRGRNRYSYDVTELSKRVTINYLRYIQYMCKDDIRGAGSGWWNLNKVQDKQKYKKLCKHFLTTNSWITDLHKIYRKKNIYNEFIFREFYENITLTHLEKRNIKCILNKSTYSGGFRERIPEADYVKRVRFYQPLDQFNLSRSRLNFALRNDICFDIMELIMNHYNRIVLKY